MSIGIAARCASRLALILALAMSFVPFDIAPAEARRIKWRFHSGSGHSGSGSSSTANPTDKREEGSQAGPRTPETAAAAAARARAALAAEKGERGPRAAARTYQPVPGAKTTGYDNGVTCIAGC